MWRMNAEKALLLLRSYTATCGQTTHVRFLPSFRDSPLFVSLVRFSARLAPFKRNARANDVVEASEDFAAKEGRRSERREEDGKRERGSRCRPRLFTYKRRESGAAGRHPNFPCFAKFSPAAVERSSHLTSRQTRAPAPHARSLLHRQPPHPSHRSSARPAGNPPQRRLPHHSM